MAAQAAQLKLNLRSSSTPTAATDAVGIVDRQRFNFGNSADYPWPRPRAKKKL